MQPDTFVSGTSLNPRYQRYLGQCHTLANDQTTFRTWIWKGRLSLTEAQREGR